MTANLRLIDQVKLLEATNRPRHPKTSPVLGMYANYPMKAMKNQFHNLVNPMNHQSAAIASPHRGVYRANVVKARHKCFKRNLLKNHLIVQQRA